MGLPQVCTPALRPMAYALWMTVPFAAIPMAVEVERRRHCRIEALVPVELEIGGLTHVARITDLSQRGARVEVDPLPDVGTAVVLKRSGVALAGRTVWSRGNEAGLEFMSPLDPKYFLRIRRGLAANL